jgi:signal transduction histidine kinase
MIPQDTKAIDALLDEAVDQQRRRVLRVGAAVRVAGALVFLAIIGVLWMTGRHDLASYPLPLSIYLGMAVALLALHGKRFVPWLDVAQSVVDVGLVFWVQHTALPMARFPAGIAGFSLGLFALMVVLSSLTLVRGVAYTTALLAAVAQGVLMREAGVSWGSVTLAAVVLLMVAFMSQYGVQRLRQLVLALTRTEQERQGEVRRSQELAQARQTIEQMLGETRAQNEQLLALQRDKDQLIQFLVHDLRSPLSALTMTFSWLEAELAIGGDLQLMQGVRSGLAVTGRMERMITELLDLPRLEEGKLELRPQRLDLTALFEEVRQAFGQAAQFRRLAMEVEAPAGTGAAGSGQRGRRPLPRRAQRRHPDRFGAALPALRQARAGGPRAGHPVGLWAGALLLPARGGGPRRAHHRGGYAGVGHLVRRAAAGAGRVEPGGLTQARLRGWRARRCGRRASGRARRHRGHPG